ncbi:hypothetical protein ACUSIJ_24690 [Pseudochelatococcus sp. B33]
MTDEKVYVSDIIEIREAGPDGGGLLGFYAKGHHDVWKFAHAVNKHTGADPEHDARYVPLRLGEEGRDIVRHEWWRTVPEAGEPGYYRFIAAEPKSRGAFAVTVTTVVDDRERRRTERYIEEFRKGSRRGFADGLHWALLQLDRINPEAGEELLRRYREQNRGQP